MKALSFSIQINKPRSDVFATLIDKSVYADWAKAWGEGMTYEGEWKEGGHISFFDNTQGGTKVVLKEFTPNECIKAEHIAMVNPENVEVELGDEMMQKWIGSKEEYYLTEDDAEHTTFKVEMEIDEAFQEMMEGTWPKALELFKGVCESA